jgi:hypothetical protein
MNFPSAFLQSACRSSSASVCMSGVHFTSAARCSRLPVAVAGTLFSVPAPEPQPVSTSAAAAATAVTASIGRVTFILFLPARASLWIRLPRAVRSKYPVPSPGRRPFEAG